MSLLREFKFERKANVRILESAPIAFRNKCGWIANRTRTGHDIYYLVVTSQSRLIGWFRERDLEPLYDSAWLIKQYKQTFPPVE